MIKTFWKKYKNIIILLLLVIYYTSCSVMVLWDSAHYMEYVNILEGKSPFSNWDIVRGPVFPFIIYLSRRIFGASHMGLLITTFLSYLLMLFVVYKLIRKISEGIDNDKYKKFFKYVVLLSVILNPIIYGYYHALLTEFVAMTITMVMIYISWMWIDVDWFENKFDYIFSVVIFIIGTVFSWHLKQPYVAITVFPMIIATIISIFQNFTLKNIVQKVITVLLCVCFMVLSIKTWNTVLVKGEHNLNTDRNVIEGFGSQLLQGVRNFVIIKDVDSFVFNELQTDKFLTNEEKNTILKKRAEENNSFYIINIFDDEEIIDREFIDFGDSRTISVFQSLKELFLMALEHPLITLDGYKIGYFILSDVYDSSKNENASYQENFTLDFHGENAAIAMTGQNIRSNIFYMTEHLYGNVQSYDVWNHPPFILRGMFKLLNAPSQLYYSLSMLSLPFLCVLILIYRFIKRNELSSFKVKENNLLIILLWFSFMNAMVYVGTACCIDRYAAVSIIPIVIAHCIILKNILFKFIK